MEAAYGVAGSCGFGLSHGDAHAIAPSSSSSSSAAATISKCGSEPFNLSWSLGAYSHESVVAADGQLDLHLLDHRGPAYLGHGKLFMLRHRRHV